MATGQPPAAGVGPTGERVLTGGAIGRLALAVATAGTISWPGGEAHVADRADALGRNISGLAVAVDDGAGAPVLWAVRDDPGKLIRLVTDGDRFVIDEAWGGPRRITWPDGRGEPDAEAVAVAGDRSDVVYVAAERDNDDASTSRPSVLEVPVGGTSGHLVATRSWDLASSLPPMDDPNTGVEGLAWVPDAALVAAGFVDDAGRPYDPAEHPGHGTGLFVTGLEDGGQLDVFALSDDGAEHLATFASGLPAVMDLTWDGARGLLWAVCDDHCDGRMAQVALGDDGGFELVATLDPPDGLAHRNDEGFAVGPCNDGVSTAVWADDEAHDDHVLRAADLACSSSGAAAGRAATGSDGSSSWSRVAVATGTALGAGAVAVAVRRRRRTTG